MENGCIKLVNKEGWKSGHSCQRFKPDSHCTSHAEKASFYHQDFLKSSKMLNWNSNVQRCAFLLVADLCENLLQCEPAQTNQGSTPTCTFMWLLLIPGLETPNAVSVRRLLHLRWWQTWCVRALLQGGHSPQLPTVMQPVHFPQRLRFFGIRCSTAFIPDSSFRSEFSSFSISCLWSRCWKVSFLLLLLLS
jgi:hypothetical protein